MNTFGYWWVVVGRIASWAWDHIIESALIGIVVFAVRDYYK